MDRYTKIREPGGKFLEIDGKYTQYAFFFLNLSHNGEDVREAKVKAAKMAGLAKKREELTDAQIRTFHNHPATQRYLNYIAVEGQEKAKNDVAALYNSGIECARLAYELLTRQLESARNEGKDLPIPHMKAVVEMMREIQNMAGLAPPKRIEADVKQEVRVEEQFDLSCFDDKELAVLEYLTGKAAAKAVN